MRGKRSSYCNHHRHEIEKERDPVAFAYRKLKSNAKLRGKTFTITIDDFRAFCQKLPYMVGKGRTKDSYHIDRIDNSKGYEPGNLQLLTNAENRRKQLMADYSDHRRPYCRVAVISPSVYKQTNPAAPNHCTF